MPQPPNMQQMMRQVQKMQQDMLAAQEQLKTEEVEASAGGGMVTVRITGDLQVKAVTIDPDAIDPEDPELLQDMVLAAINEATSQGAGARRAQARRPRRRPGPRRPRRARACRACERAPYAPPVQRLITELGKLPGIGPRTAQRLAFHILRADPRGCDRARGRDPRGQGEDRLVRDLLQPRRRPALPHLPGRASRRRADLRRRGAGRRHPDRAHARVPRRYHVLGGALSPIDGIDPEDLKIAELYERDRRRRAPVREVVLATNPTTTGEATALHVAAGSASVRPRSP